MPAWHLEVPTFNERENLLHAALPGTHVLVVDDGSHAPAQLQRLLARADAGADLVPGSRYVPGGTVVNWPKHREWALPRRQHRPRGAGEGDPVGLAARFARAKTLVGSSRSRRLAPRGA